MLNTALLVWYVAFIIINIRNFNIYIYKYNTATDNKNNAKALLEFPGGAFFSTSELGLEIRFLIQTTLLSR